MPHSSFCSSRDDAQSPDGQVALMQAPAAAWNFSLVHTHPMSALTRTSGERHGLKITKRAAYYDEHPAAEAAAAEQLMMHESMKNALAESAAEAMTAMEATLANMVS